MSWNYLDTRGDDGLETIICRLKRPEEVERRHDAQTLFQAARCPLPTSPIWPLPDPNGQPGGFHLQMKPPATHCHKPPDLGIDVRHKVHLYH